MRKLIISVMVLAFVFSFAVGAMVSSVDAKPPIPCEYRCIAADWYLCCMYPAPVGEVCYFQHYCCY